jgi:hypothetical protein
MADAAVSNTADRKVVWVRIPPSAPRQPDGARRSGRAFPLHGLGELLERPVERGRMPDLVAADHALPVADLAEGRRNAADDNLDMVAEDQDAVAEPLYPPAPRARRAGVCVDRSRHSRHGQMVARVDPISAPQ